MTPLYSKETERRAISILSSGINNHPPKIKDETAILIGLIENGNEVMEYLIMVDRTLCANGAYNASTKTRELIKKIKGEV